MSVRLLAWIAVAVVAWGVLGCLGARPAFLGGSKPSHEFASHDAVEPTVKKTDEEWRKALTPEQYRVMREKGTERAFSGKYWDTKTPGEYRCAACGALLFASDTKFDSGCGWPSFFKPAAGAGITETRDESGGMERTEVTCSHCGAHLGHVFDDGPNPTGLRYCINSVSIDLQPKATDEKAK